ncbi:MAG: hypothetical protein U0J86_02125 [Collinsella sp.]|nr:hypothetical protein [Collinsella sp.]
MLNPLYYLAHDPVGNCEWQITEFDSGVLSEAESAGVVFIAVDKDGNREHVAAQDIKEPESSAGNLVLVQPVYVDDRMKAVVAVFDALAASVPAVAASADVQPVSSNARSAMSFAEALEALRALAYGTVEEGGE